MATVLDSYPMNDTVSDPSAGAESENEPFAPEVVPISVPSTMTVAPTTG